MKEEYKEIAAYEAEDYKAVVEHLAADESFKRTLTAVSHQQLHDSVNPDEIFAKIRSAGSLEQWDEVIFYPLMRWIAAHTSSGLRLTGTEHLRQKALYLTNHRDILLDSTLLSLLIHQQGYFRPYIGIGTNLYVESWIEPLVRLNRAFSVRRGGTPRELLRNSQQMSAYIDYVINQKGESVWLAQREGRAKNSDDRTQSAILKMLTIAGEGDFIERVEKLNITPVSLCYEYDPCDFLKAQEMQLKRDNKEYKKTPQDDYINMQTGLLGWKGQIVFCVTPSISGELEFVREKTAIRNEQADLISQIIDSHIHANYHIFNTNRIAYDLYFNTDRHKSEYTEEEKAEFVLYLQKRIDKIQIANKDSEFLRLKILEMYANPLKNKLATEK